MQTITTNTPITSSSMSDVATINKQITRHINYLRDLLANDSITKDIVARKINHIKSLCSIDRDFDLFKSNLKIIKNMLEDYYNKKTYIDINLQEAAEDNSLRKLTPIVTKIQKQVDNLSQHIHQHLQKNNYNLEFLSQIKIELTEYYNIIINLVTEHNDITTGDLLIQLTESLEKINNAQTVINLLAKKELIISQLTEFEKNWYNNSLISLYIKELLASPDNFEVLEHFVSLYNQVIDKYLLSIDANMLDFDYKAAYDKLCLANSNNKKILAKQEEQKNAIEKLNILNDKIIDLANKLENINDIKLSYS